jgi:inner membrane transporter RhtA
VFNLVPQLQKSFPAIGAAGTASLRIEFQLSYSSPFIDLIYSRHLPKSKSLWFVPWGHEFDFYLAIERIPIGLAVTLEFIGPLWSLFLAQNVCRLFMGTSCSSRNCFDRSVDK